MAGGGNERELSRRRFLQSGAAAATLAWLPVTRLAIGEPAPLDAAPTPTPPAFPSGIEVYRQAYENWSTEIRVDDVWTCTPRTTADVVTLANWAHTHGWRLRPSGSKHGWAPFNVLWQQPSDLKVMLVDTTAHLNSVVLRKEAGHHVVTVGPGALLDEVLVTMQQAGRGWTCIPAPGDITVAGAIAINGHGAALPAVGEKTPKYAFGSLSNRIVSLDAVVWDPARNAYVERGFHRSEKITKALLTTLGRMFITRYTLVTESVENLRCVSYMTIPGAELVGKSGSKGRTFEKFTDEAGRIELIWFPSTHSPWTKVWSVTPKQPPTSRHTKEAYNYPFSDNIPRELSDMAKRCVNGEPELTPAFGKAAMNAATAGVHAFDATDLWGPARNTQHYIKPTTIRAGEFGWAVVTSRQNIQRVLHDFVTKVHELDKKYAARGHYPASMPLEMRCSGVDTVEGLGIPGAEPSVLAATTPDVDHPEWDVVVWLNVLSLPGTPGVFEYKTELEQWTIRHYSGWSTCRPEWTKSWAFSPTRDFTNPEVLDHAIPNALRRGRPQNANWDWAMRVFNELDPHKVFGNPFTDRLLK